MLLYKKWGQVFLTDKNILSKIEKVLPPHPCYVEIGAGTGILTEILAKKGKVLAIEKDRRFVEVLKEKFKRSQNVKVFQGDALFLLKKINLQGLIVVGNIPYCITSPLLRVIFEKKNLPEDIFFTVQKEIAQRICEKNKKSCFLSAFVNFYAFPKIIFYISRNSFFPKPKVDSAFVEILPKKTLPFEDKKDFLKMLKVGYAFKRKTLLNNFLKHLKDKKEEFKKTFSQLSWAPKRPEELKLKDWEKIFQFLSENNFLNKLKV